MPIIEELKRRNVVKVTIAYGLVAWLIAQLAEFATSTFGAPDWVLRTFVALLMLGLPIAIVLAWVFDITPSGIRKESAGKTAPTESRGVNFMAVILLGVVLVAAVTLQFWGPEMPVPHLEKAAGHTGTMPSFHADIAFPDDIDLAFVGAAALGNGRRAFAISPDGQRMVFTGVENGEHALYLRELDSHDVRKLGNSENGYDPFFSPNGQWVAFFAGNQLKRVASAGGDAVAVTEATNSNGGTWVGNDGLLVLTDEGSDLLQFSFGGAREESQSPINAGAPHALPSGSQVLLSGRQQVVALDTAKMETTTLPVRGDDPRYLGGFLFYTQGDTLIAARFDPETLSLKSTPVPVLTGLRTEIYGFSQWSLANNGTLLYAPGISAAENPLIWVGTNQRQDLQLPQRHKGSFEISPDGKKLLVVEFQPGTSDLWFYDLEDGTSRKLTNESGFISQPLSWMPDSKQVIYHHRTATGGTPLVMSLDSGNPGKPLINDGKDSLFVYSISADGRFLGIERFPEPSDANLGEAPPDHVAVLDLVEDREIRIPMVDNSNWGMAISPDGTAIVYTSSVTGEYQNYLQPVPPTGVRHQVSRVGGAEEPRWSRDGSKIYYRSGLRIMVVDVQSSPEIVLGEPRVFYEGSFVNVGGRSFDISPDGTRALVIEGPEDTATSIRLITNWLDEVERIVSASEDP